MPSPYTRLITSEHNQQPNFMAMVDMDTGSVAAITAGIQAIIPAFDLDEAVGVQLDIIGLWVGQSRVIDQVLIVGFFGFEDDEAAANFGELTDVSIGGPFYELGAAFEGTTVLSDDDYRAILRARIVRNQSNGTLSDIEAGLEYIFGGLCSVADIGDLSLNITVSTPVTQTQQTLLRTLDLLPRPAGVAIGSITYVS